MFGPRPTGRCDQVFEPWRCEKKGEAASGARGTHRLVALLEGGELLGGFDHLNHLGTVGWG